VVFPGSGSSFNVPFGGRLRRYISSGEQHCCLALCGADESGETGIGPETSGERRVMPFFNVLFGGRLRRYISCTTLHCYLELSATVRMEILLPLAGYEGIYPEMTYVVGTQVTNCRRLRRDRTRQGASSRANIPCDRRRLQGYICPERKYRSLTGCPNRR